MRGERGGDRRHGLAVERAEAKVGWIELPVRVEEGLDGGGLGTRVLGRGDGGIRQVYPGMAPEGGVRQALRREAPGLARFGED